jgi:hypothetical protein
MACRQVGITAKQLDEIEVLQLVDGLERPVVASHVKIGVDDSAIFPAGRKSLDGDVQDVLFVPQLVRGPELHVLRIAASHLERPVAVSQLGDMQDHVGAAQHVPAKVVHALPPGPPAKRIAISARYVQRFIFRPLLPGFMYIRVLAGEICYHAPTLQE